MHVVDSIPFHVWPQKRMECRNPRMVCEMWQTRMEHGRIKLRRQPNALDALAYRFLLPLTVGKEEAPSSGGAEAIGCCLCRCLCRPVLMSGKATKLVDMMDGLVGRWLCCDDVSMRQPKAKHKWAVNNATNQCPLSRRSSVARALVNPSCCAFGVKAGFLNGVAVFYFFFFFFFFFLNFVFS